MKKIITIGKKRAQAFVLKETEEAIVYIPLKSLHLEDYKRLLDMTNRTKIDLLTTMRDTRLDNGRNALVTYQNIIETYTFKKDKSEVEVQATSGDVTLKGDQVVTEDGKKKAETAEKPQKKRGPGRPRKNPQV